MIKKILLNLALLLVLSNCLQAQVKLSKSDMTKLDFEKLAANKKKLLAKDTTLLAAYQQLLKEADIALAFKPVSVMDKKDIPPSGNKHDYMSIGPYWWPDPSKPNGLPYIRKDGTINPEVNNYPDKDHLPKLCEYVNDLALAYYFSNNEQYAIHASELMKVWFLDSATKMNPNLNFGQAIKGVINGRAEGLIDTRLFIYLIDGLELLKTSKSWTAQDQSQIKNWFSEFLTWAQNNSIGQDEMNAKNNHGVWYDAQTLSIALFLDSTELANKIIKRAANRLDEEMDNNGLFPLELARTTSLHYSVFILNAFTIVAQLSEKTNTNFWTLETKSGKSLKKAIDAHLPYLAKEKTWTSPQIKEFHTSDAFPILLMAGRKLNCTSCNSIIKKETGDAYNTLILHLL